MNNLFYKKLLSFGVQKNFIIRFSFDNDEHLDRLDNYFPEEPAKTKGKNDFYMVNSKKLRAYIKDVASEPGDYHLLLDEIKILDSFAGTLNGFLSCENYDVYVTGSNSQLLSSEIETSFRGRKASVHKFPLSFGELMAAFNLASDEAWREYLVAEGIPHRLQAGKKDRQNYLYELAYEVYLKDISQTQKNTKFSKIWSLDSKSNVPVVFYGYKKPCQIRLLIGWKPLLLLSGTHLVSSR